MPPLFKHGESNASGGAGLCLPWAAGTPQAGHRASLGLWCKALELLFAGAQVLNPLILQEKPERGIIDTHYEAE